MTKTTTSTTTKTTPSTTPKTFKTLSNTTNIPKKIKEMETDKLLGLVLPKNRTKSKEIVTTRPNTFLHRKRTTTTPFECCNLINQNCCDYNFETNPFLSMLNDYQNSIGNSRASILPLNSILSDKPPVCFNHTVIKFITIPVTEIKTTTKSQRIWINKTKNDLNPKIPRNKSYGKPVLFPFSTTSKQTTLVKVSTSSNLTIYNSSISKLQTPANDALYKTILLINNTTFKFRI